jgi:hypothetical protein
MCALVGNQQSCGVVTAWVRTDAIQSLRHQRRDLHQSTYPYLSEDRDSSYYQVVLDFQFPVRYTCVSFSLFPVFISRSTKKAKKNSYLPLSYNPESHKFCFSYFVEFVSIVVESCCWLDSCS